MIGLVVVVKIGNRAMEHALSDAALNDLQKLRQEMSAVIVHGGGDTVTSIAEKLGIQQKFVTSPEGFRSRYTDIDTIRIFTMVMAGKINKEIVLRLQSWNIPAIGLSGLDGALIRAERKKKLIIIDQGRRRVIDGGYTGRVTSVNSKLIQILLNSGYLPVITPIALGAENEPLNLDGDRTAAHVAAALEANLLLLMTDVQHVSLNGTQIARFTAEEAKRALPNLGPGMITKVHASLEALSMGVSKVIIAPSTPNTPYTSAVQEKSGTVIVA